MTAWQAYERVNGPLDLGARVDQAGALVAATLANVMGTGQRRFTLADFLPAWGQGPGVAGGDGEDPEQADATRMLQIALTINKRLGGEDLREHPQTPHGQDRDRSE